MEEGEFTNNPKVTHPFIPKTQSNGIVRLHFHAGYMVDIRSNSFIFDIRVK